MKSLGVYDANPAEIGITFRTKASPGNIRSGMNSTELSNLLDIVGKSNIPKMAIMEKRILLV